MIYMVGSYLVLEKYWKFHIRAQQSVKSKAAERFKVRWREAEAKLSHKSTAVSKVESSRTVPGEVARG